ncbi:DUF3971 domain-containing protein [Aliirhizobium terrae]|uniref:YhdP family protein n=1 Tax=Terrirhizobium terrae TaxID=2926709 RepID=UPI0025780351|nr:DUF3971 domain-containing protein [Rhizobium sp. CC-CFT758]WJH40093.1 DUF3971 domain-containing protein [Rhizobium sp. CC-CFT758]
MAASLKVKFGDKSPEISFGGKLPKFQVTGVKQLWPFWMARKPRDWIMQNLFGGELTDGTIAVFIPAGRMKGPGIPMELDGNELQISFDLADSRLNLPGDFPPLRDINARFALKGENLAVDFSKAATYAPSGRIVTVNGGRFLFRTRMKSRLWPTWRYSFPAMPTRLRNSPISHRCAL